MLAWNINKALKYKYFCRRDVAAASPEEGDFQELLENGDEDEEEKKKNEDMLSAGAANPGFTATHSRHPDLRLAAARWERR